MPLYPGTSADDVLTGSAGSDSIAGYAGNDTIDDGGGGPDELAGGTGNDTYLISDARDTIVEYAGEGTDTVRTALSRYVLASNVENLTYTGIGAFAGQGNEGDNAIVGGSGDDLLMGFDGRDYLSGGAGNDTLDGGTGIANTLQGGTGNDAYVVGAIGDSIVEIAGEGTDTVRTALSGFILPANVENLVFTGTGAFLGQGNGGDNVIVGGAGADPLRGFDGRDYLIGGAGDDTLDGGTGVANQLQGGEGNDTYVVSALGDSVTEFANEGVDTVRTLLASFVLPANVDNLVYTGTGNFSGVGNALDNVITGGTGRDELQGGAGSDTLDGGSGAANTLIGGDGDDLYRVGAVGDSIVETAAGGHDSVRTALASFTLPANVEDLTFTGTGGSTGFGNAGDNYITGAAGGDTLYGLDGNDVIDGMGGANRLEGGNGSDTLYGGGGDTLVGGAGDDVYWFKSTNATIVELPGEGIDTVYVGTSGTYTLPEYVEIIRPIFALANGLEFDLGPGTIFANALDNTIYSNSSNPLLYGLDGNDTIVAASPGETMIGGNGNDIFFVSGASTLRYLGGETGTDSVQPVSWSPTATPRIELSQAWFTPTDSFSFVRGPGAVATGANSAFIQDTNTGLVSYDDDGSGPGAAIPLFYFSGTLTHDSFSFAFFQG